MCDTKENQTAEAVEYWKNHEKFHRDIIFKKVSQIEEYILEINALEKNLQAMVVSIDICNIDTEKLLFFLNYAIDKEEELLYKIRNRSHINK